MSATGQCSFEPGKLSKQYLTWISTYKKAVTLKEKFTFVLLNIKKDRIKVLNRLFYVFPASVEKHSTNTCKVKHNKRNHITVKVQNTT